MPDPSDMRDYLRAAFCAKGHLSKELPGYKPRQAQMDYAHAVDCAIADKKHLMADGPTGCHAKGQEILMHDGSVKKVEDIQVGDTLMGPDSLPRVVLALARGREEMAEIIPVKGDPWTVNVSHVLSLVRTNTRPATVEGGRRRRRDYLGGAVVDVQVCDWEGWSKTKKHIHKLFRVGVDFTRRRKTHPILPYHLGLLIGDGCLCAVNSTVSITTADHEIVDAIWLLARRFELSVRAVVKKDNAAKAYYLGRKGPVGSKRNPLSQALRALGLYGKTSWDKFIPERYKRGSIGERIDLLAGLIDTDGHLTSSNTYEYVTASRRLAEDVLFVARSLGFAAYRSWKTIKGKKYSRITISGDVAYIPCRVGRKSAKVRQQKKSVLRTGFTVERTGKKAAYYGFSLDGDGRYLLGDFTVTHNTGKSFGYGVPATFYASRGERVVIVTSNIALQEQLHHKDLPLLREALPWRFTWAMLKGRSNYLCVRRLAEFELTGDLFHKASADDEEMAQVIIGWSAMTGTGDVSELPFEPPSRVWRKFSSSSDDCRGSGCPFINDCWSAEARRALGSVDVVVTNYHVLLSHLKVMVQYNKALLLPPHSILILDEAHKAADIARDFLGDRVSHFTIKRLAGSLGDQGRLDLETKSAAFFAALKRYAASPSYKIRLKRRDPVPWHDLYRGLGAAMETFIARRDSTTDPEERAVARKATTRAAEVRSFLEAAMTNPAQPGMVHYIEEMRSGVALRSKMVKPARWLHDNLFHPRSDEEFCSANLPSTAVMTSATLATGGSFDYVARELGCTRFYEAIVPSPFDWQSRALMVLPDMPNPNDPSFADAVAVELAKAIKGAGGRTLALFTSYRVLNHVHGQLMQEDLGVRIMRQGELPRTALVEEFKDDESSVLLGTESFWGGVDVPGDALCCLVVDKIPFPRPDDPVMDAISAQSRRWFMEQSVPRAAMALRQGVGRLIRSVDDYGVVMLLDARLTGKGYGKIFLRSLPAMARTGDTAAIDQFLADMRADEEKEVA